MYLVVLLHKEQASLEKKGKKKKRRAFKHDAEGGPGPGRALEMP